MIMARRRKTRDEIAAEARERHERLCRLAEKRAGQPGITKLRLRVQDALVERMRAEQRAGWAS